MSETFDRRLTPARPDIAAAHLKGRVTAERFVEGAVMEVKEGVVDLRREPRPDCPIDTQALYGERVIVYDEEEGWAWAQLARDGYVGWIAANTLWSALRAPTHRICVPRTFVYPAASIKQPPLLALPLSAEVEIVDSRDNFLVTRDLGFIWRPHLAPLDATAPDFVAVAETMIGAPYLWGGKSSIGVDCSGLVQISLAAAGKPAPRDSDMQEAQLGEPVDIGAPLMRGDLIFWKGHVGIMRDAATLLHANGAHMLVSSEPLDLVRARNLEAGAGDITSVKRLTR
ncbi:NlpC/P60 family protein [Methylocystis sp. MJC1]|uniref:C40 family peptidase n=1 Tax=Methylocystis sp. MJC1 TaxID=2654282 RepID=UPI0013EE3B38|nr:NlpC/P60 family protein [Methylocystis sp. MJC1]KAF2992271.1 Gamma-D-glutamyl-L-lysine endopeptidase [Methylocystis sp. MJC1]MBU6527411.1 C40 family peptidase [Methylocystis sp. MJC1]UZX10361.1 NlpC/P60 family protein [Methylocystis sp. MJC1]